MQVAIGDERMRRVITLLVVLVAASISFGSAGFAQTKEKRVAFVVGNATYAAGALPTAANDAGLIAQTLQAAGFDVVGARDLDAETFRQSYGEFLKRLSAGGADTVAFIYVAGYGLQYGNENYLVPIGATVARDLDIPIEAVRLNDLIAPLAGLNLKARFAVFDVGYPSPFAKGGAPLAGGLALVDAAPGSLIAYNAAPGTVAPVGKGNYGPYAQALAAMMREGGIAPDVLFDRVRLQVNEATKGDAVPWDSSKIDAAFRFFDLGPGAPAPQATVNGAAMRTKPIRDFAVGEAYSAALDRDTIGGYEEFLTAYGRDPLAKRVRALLAARREAITWNRTAAADTPDAYWSYLQRYPRGPHRGAARMRLQALSAAFDPPPRFAEIAYDVPPPPEDEYAYVDRPVIYFADPDYGFSPPPPPPDYFLPPIPVAFLDLGPPPPPDALFFLPYPAFVPLPDYVNPPVYVYAPEHNVFFANQGGGGGPGGAGFGALHQPHAAGGFGQAAVVAGVAAAAVALPVAVAARNANLQKLGITTPAALNKSRAEGRLGAPGPAGGRAPLAATQQLPGANGRPLPQGNGPPPAGRPGLAPAARGNPAANANPAASGAPAANARPFSGAVQRNAAGPATTPRAQRQERIQAQRAARVQVRQQAPAVAARNAAPRAAVQRPAAQQIQRAAPRAVQAPRPAAVSRPAAPPRAAAPALRAVPPPPRAAPPPPRAAPPPPRAAPPPPRAAPAGPAKRPGMP